MNIIVNIINVALHVFYRDEMKKNKSISAGMMGDGGRISPRYKNEKSTAVIWAYIYIYIYPHIYPHILISVYNHLYITIVDGCRRCVHDIRNFLPKSNGS